MWKVRYVSTEKASRTKINKDFYQFAEKDEKNNIAKFNVFTEVIENFPPDAELEFYLAQSFVVFGDKANEALTPRVFNISATYGYSNKEVTEKTTVDLMPYLNNTIPQDPKINELKGIKEAIEEQTKKLAKP